MIVLGIILAIGLIVRTTINFLLTAIGIMLIVVGVVLWILGRSRTPDRRSGPLVLGARRGGRL